MNIKIKNLLIIALMVCFVQSTQAEENLSIKILTPTAIKSLLGEYPKKGSSEEAQDYEVLLDWQKNRTSEECKLADHQDKANFVNLFSKDNGPLTLKEAKMYEKLFAIKIANIGANIVIAKKIYKRPRPYEANLEIKPCISKESSSAYPSGHTTISYAMAGFLSDKMPERKIAFYNRAEQNSLNRVIGGVHHPSDIEAGKILGNTLYNLMKSDD